MQGGIEQTIFGNNERMYECVEGWGSIKLGRERRKEYIKENIGEYSRNKRLRSRERIVSGEAHIKVNSWDRRKGGGRGRSWKESRRKRGRVGKKSERI